MKKLLTSLALLSFSFTLIYAQDDGFSSGILFNANGIHITGDEEVFWDSNDGKVWGSGGLSAGIFVNKELSANVFGSIELRYIRKGSVYEFTDATVGYALPRWEVLKLNYVEIPVLIGYNLNYDKKKYLLFNTGLGFAKMFSSKVDLKDISRRKKSPGIANFIEFDLSWVGEVKLPINPTKKDNLLLGLRVAHSIMSIHKVYKLYNFDYGVQIDYRI